MVYQQICFGHYDKPPYCIIYRDAIASSPLIIFWILTPFYWRIWRKNEPVLNAPDNFWAHLIILGLLTSSHAIFGILQFPESSNFLIFQRFFVIISYINCFLWLCVLSKRLNSIHVSYRIAFLVLAILKFVHVLILSLEQTVDSLTIIEMALLAGEAALLTAAKRQNDVTNSAEERSSFVSKIFFCWMNQLVGIGARRALKYEDLYELNHDATSEYLNEKWVNQWEKDRKKNASLGKETSIVWPFVRFNKKLIISITFARFVADIVHYLNPILLKQLIEYVSLNDQPLSFGIGIACLMFLSTTTRSLLQNFQISGMFRLAVYYQSVLSNAVLNKILRLSPSARTHRTAGEILNHVAVDIEIIIHALPYLQNLWSVPFQVTLAMIMLWYTLGAAALAGVIIMLLFIPLNLFTSKFIKRSQMSQMRVKDERTKLSNEMLNGMKVVKLYAWEESFESRINGLRAKEVRMLRNVCVLSRIVDIANAASPFLVAIASFTCFVWLSNDATALTPSVAFVAVTVFNQLRQPMRMVANLINTLVQARVSNKRLRRFLNDEEMGKRTEFAIGNAIVFGNVSLNWKGINHPAVLKNISATIKTGQLVAIVGSVGGGKSSLVSSILDEMVLLEGRLKVGGSLAYVPQHSWIFNKSIEQNILFGNVPNQEFYERVVDTCQLRADFQNLPNGQQTIVGENGITLSGGQKSRISLARAVYQDKDIYLLDDPLSAVDAHVGRAIFDQVIGPNGLLAHKTRVLVTHNLQYTRYVDMIYVIEDGEIVENGKFEELSGKNGAFGRLWSELESIQLEDGDESEEERRMENVIVGEKKKGSELKIEEKPKREILNEEKVQLGRVKKSVYLLYLRTMGMVNSVGFLVFFILHYTFMIARSLWLSDWSNNNAELRKVSNSSSMFLETDTRLLVYATIVVLLALAFTLLTIGSLRASYSLHAPLIRSLLRAPITFFDITPIGRIINRLSRDLDVIDRLQDGVRMVLQSSLNACMILVLISISTPIFLFAAVPLILIYYFVMTYYIPTSRQLKRLESANRSPILSTISESIHGASSIRAFNKIANTSRELSTSVDRFAQCRYLTCMANRWLATRLELLGNTTVLFASLSATISIKYFGLTPGMAGLSVSYALTITEVLNMCVRTMSEIESNIVSVERVHEYQNIDCEAKWEINESLADESWPRSGSIKFENFSMKYRPDLPLVLKNVNLWIRGGEKIGIIGRTGSGKSTLTMALYRMMEGEQGGSIAIDGMRIDRVGLHQLRHKLIIIPQEPVVFSGTLRFNLDPFGEYSDERIWESLEICQLRQFAMEEQMKLDRYIAEGGKNMSMGERQLLCLCRAILRGGRIVILDEATASVDPVTDGIVQRAIRTHFPMSTTIAIAHRLDTISDADRIVVMDAGSVAEFDTPATLLQNPNSLYSQLLNEKNRK